MENKILNLIKKFFNLSVAILIILLFIFVYKINNKESDSEYVTKLCRQSPININSNNISIKNSDILNLGFFNKNINARLVETTKKDNISYLVDENVISYFNGHKYKLIQFHFHYPSEHKINNKTYDMEVHFVNRSIEKKNENLVIAFFLKKGTVGVFDSCLRLDNKVEIKLNDTNLENFFFYPGSLTTDPFSSNVTWIVFENPIESSNINIWNKRLGKARKISTNFFAGEVLKFNRK